MTEPFGVTLDFQYDKADNRTQVIDNKGGQSDYVYDDLNRLTTLTLSGSGVTGTSTAWAYDKTTADLTSVTKAVGGTASGTTAYGYDALGRNDSVTQSNGSGVTVGSYTYTRDLADRLTGSTFVTGGVTSSHSFSYYDDNQLKVADGVLSKYDDGGNLTGTYNAATGAQLSSSTYGTANRLQNDGVYTYTYDDAGQMTGKSKSGESWSYGYDSNGQMVSASNGTDAVSYTFDAFGNRLSRVQTGGTSKTERFAYDGADAFLDLDGSNAVTVRRQYGPGVDNLLSRQSGGSVEWYGTDAQGSVRQVFDNKGKQTSWADYEAHGALVGGGTLTDRYGFTGREEDDLTGQRYHRARVVDGQSWTSEDPMGFAAGDANLRRYTGNSPTNGRDPSGMDYLTIENDTVYFERHYYAEFWNWFKGGRFTAGKLIEKNGIQYVQSGQYLVPLDVLREAVEGQFFGQSGYWIDDDTKRTEWFKKHDVTGKIEGEVGTGIIPFVPRITGDGEIPAYSAVMLAGVRINTVFVTLASDVLTQLTSVFAPARMAQFFRYVANKGLGGKALKVVKNNKGEITHIADEAGNKLSQKQLEQLKKEFQAAHPASPAKGWKSTNTGNTGGNSAALRKNLKGGVREGEDAHHLVPSTHPRAAESRAILDKYQIDINAAENGVGLKPSGPRPAHHGNGLHSCDSIDAVTERLKNATKDIADWEQGREAVLSELAKIKQEILSGVFPP